MPLAFVFALITAFLFSFTPMHAQPMAMSPSTEADPDAFVAECVNVINGDFCRSALDFVVQGPDKLVLQRCYSNRNYITGKGVGGWRLFSDLFLVVGTPSRGDALHNTYAVTEGTRRMSQSSWHPEVSLAIL